MQILKKSLSILVVCALLLSYMPAISLPAQAAETVQTKLLDFDTVLPTSTTVTNNTGYSQVTTSVVSGKGIEGSAAQKYSMDSQAKGNSENINFFIASTAVNDTDILWFWVDSDLSVDRLLHIQVYNGSAWSYLATDYVYTIVNDNGSAKIQQVDYDAEGTTSGDGFALVASGGSGGEAGTDKYARIRMEADWYGWIGIPIANFCGNSSTAPTSIERIVIRTYGAANSALVNEAIYLDDFWLTSVDAMPNLTTDQLFYDADYVPVVRQELLWNIEGSSVDIDGTYSDDTRNHSYLKTSSGTGISGSAALKYGIASNPGHDMTNTINFNPVTYGLDGTVTINALDDIIWYWVDLDYAEDQYLQFSVNNITLANNTSGYVYTIAADENGDPQIVTIPYGSNDTVEGVDLKQHSASSNVSILKLYDGFNGWIGVPVSMFSSGTSALAVGDKVTKFGIVVRQKSDGVLSNQSVADCIYLDEFWITSAGLMPNLSNEALLWDGDPAPVENVTLADRYQNGMIFQRDEQWQIHGTATAGQTVTVELLQESTVIQTKSATAANDGSFTVVMDAVAGSYTSYTVEVTCGSTTKNVSDVVFGEVWVTGGQSNMFYTISQTNNTMFDSDADVTALQSYLTANPDRAAAIRMYYSDALPTPTDTEQTEVVGTWKTATNWTAVEGTSAVAMYYAKLLQAELDMPVGVVVAARGGTSIGTWVDADVAAQYSEFTALVNSLGYNSADAGHQYTLSGYYNAHVAPWQGYNVAGLLWYQGENDRYNPEMQTLGYEVMVESFSRTFTTDYASSGLMDVIGVQIAPYADPRTINSTAVIYDPEMKNNAFLNEAMRAGAAKVQAKGGNVVLVPIYDLPAIVDDHHPLNKLDVATRIITVAKETYYDTVSGNESYSGPKLVSAVVEDGSVLLTFDQDIQYIQLTKENNERIQKTGTTYSYELPAESELYGDKLNGFGIWTGLTYVSAEAEIVGSKQVRVTVPAGVTAAGVTYGYFLEVLSANLYDTDGFPALPFRYVTGEYVDHATRLWSADEVEAVVIKEANASSGRNTSKISIADAVGFGGSQGLKYELVDAGAQRTHTWSSSAIGDYGFRTDITVANEDDILWFWLDANVSTVQRLQIAINGQHIAYTEDAYLYTLRSGADSEPVIVQLGAGGDDNVDRISFMQHGASSGQGQLQLEYDWTGWIGVPVSAIANNAVTAGDTITTLSVLLVQNDDKNYAAQKVGDSVVLDEFWLTSAGKMPEMSDLIHYQIGFVDFEHSSLTDGKVLEGMPETNASNDTVQAQIVADIGVGESQALSYIWKTANRTNSNNVYLMEDTLGEAYTKPKITDSSNILWFWVDSDLPVERLLHVQVNNQLPAADQSIYTIGTVDGKPAILTVAPNATVDGLQLLDSTGNAITDSSTYARIRIAANWCGWIGIPIANFTYKSGTIDAPSGYLSSITLRTFGSANSILKGEAVFFDEFWLTEAGLMPALSYSKLPYSTEHQTGIWALDESDAALTDPFVIDNAERNQAVISRVTEQGVLGSNSLRYTLAELVSDTGDNRLDLTETLKLIDNESTDTNELSANGFTTGVKVAAETDILWFWIDSDMSRNMRIQPGVNNLGIRGGFEESNPTELSVNENIWVYTIEDVNGVPTMKRLYQESCAAVVDGVGLVNSARGDKGEYAQLKFTEGWSGWIGIPLNMLYDYDDPTAKISVGDTVREITLQMRIYNGVDGSMYKQVANESMYIDEFWLTTVWMMPDLTNEGLLYKDPEIPVEDGKLLSPETADCYIDLINADAGNLVKTTEDWTASASQTVDQFSFEVVKGKGYLGGNAFALGFAGTNPGNYTNWGHIFPTDADTISALGITGGTGVKTTGMLWFWVDGSDLSTDARLDVRLNGKKNDYSGVYYTIVAGTNGYYLAENALVATGTNSTGTITGGVDGVVPVAQGFQGWIGIPLESYFFDTTNITIAETVDIQKISFHLKKTGDGAKHTAGSTIYISDLYFGDLQTQTANSVEYTTWEIPPMAELKFSSASLVLENGISVKFKAKPGLFVDESVEDTIFYHTPYAIFTLHDVVNVIPGVYNEATGMYEFTYYNIRPDWMGDDINAYLYAYRDGTLYRSAEVKLYSIEDYCYNMLNRYYGSSAADGNDALADLIVDVLKYGAAAQNYTNHNTGALVTAGLSGTAWEGWGNQQTLNLTSHQQITAAVETPEASWKGAALFLRETTRIRLQFASELTDDLSIRVSCGAQNWTIGSDKLTKSGKNYYFYFDGLNATQMHQPVTFQVYSGDTPVSNILTYSVETYARSAINGTNALLKDLMTALIRYGDSAIAYVNSVS